MHLGSAQIQIEKFVAQDFSFQNEPHIEWLMPAVKVMKLDEVNTRILFKDNLLDIVSFDGHGEGIRTQLTGRMDYSGRLNSQMKLFLYGGMIREIPYLSSKALPKNANGEYEIPITLSGNFPDLEVKVNLSLVTRAVGGILRDALKTFF
jgi:hypothetical protein